MANKEWLRNRANEMAECPTTSEARAMHSLTAAGIECFAQVVFSNYILDFVIPSKLLVLEIDGATHDDQALYDSFRDAFCVAMGLQVLRIPNHLAHTAAEQVVKYPDRPDFLERTRVAFFCANGSLPGGKRPESKRPPRVSEADKKLKEQKRAAKKAHGKKKHLENEARRLANLAAKEAGLPSPRELRRREKQKTSRPKSR